MFLRKKLGNDTKKSLLQCSKTDRNTPEEQAAFIFRHTKGHPMAEEDLDQLVGTHKYKPTHQYLQCLSSTAIILLSSDCLTANSWKEQRSTQNQPLVAKLAITQWVTFH